MQDKKPLSAEMAGSLVPQLEGAPHSAGHPCRSPAPPAPKSQDKGGMRHPG